MTWDSLDMQTRDLGKRLGLVMGHTPLRHAQSHGRLLTDRKKLALVAMRS